MIFISSLTVRLQAPGDRTGQIAQFWSYSSKIKLEIWAVKNQPDSSISLLTELLSTKSTVQQW